MKIRFPHHIAPGLAALGCICLARADPTDPRTAACVRVDAVPSLELRFEFDLPAELERPRLSLSPNGTHLLVSGRGSVHDPASGVETRQGLTVHDLATGDSILDEPAAPTGSGAPRFSEDGSWVAWGSPGEDAEGESSNRARLHLLHLGEGTHRTLDLPHRSRAGTLPTLAAIDAGVDRVAFVEEVDRHDQALVVLDLDSEERILVDAEFLEPYRGRGDDPVVYFHGAHILYHTRPATESGGAGYRLQVRALVPQLPSLELPAWVSNSTDRFQRLRTGGVVNAGVDHRFELIDPTTGNRRFLFECRDELYSHFLETHLSADQRYLVAWSRERDVLVRCKIAEGGRTLHSIEEPDGLRSVFGLSPEGRFAYMRARTWPDADKSRPGHDRLVAFGFEDDRIAATLLDPMPDQVLVSRDGRTLVARSGTRVAVYDVN